MATPYLQLRRSTVPSTMEIARSELETLPVVVSASGQTTGRGRTGADWVTAPRAVATSVAFVADKRDSRPFSLVAGVAAHRTFADVELKWPNDILKRELKVGGILVERTDETVVVGMGVNLFWPDPEVAGAGALFESDPGESASHEYGALWAAEMLDMIGSPSWPVDEYRAACSTLGTEISWEPKGQGRAVDIAIDGSLVVETGGTQRSIYSGAVTHIRGKS